MRKLLIAYFFTGPFIFRYQQVLAGTRKVAMEEETLKSVIFFPISFYRNISNLSM